MSALGQKQTCAVQLGMSALCHKRTCVGGLSKIIDAPESRTMSAWDEAA